MRHRSNKSILVIVLDWLARIAPVCLRWLDFRAAKPCNFHTTICILIGLLIPSSTAYAQRVPTDKEYPIKAAFLFNFVKYVEWPARSHSDAQSPIVITVLGTNPFDSALNTIVNGRSVNGRPVAVKYAKTADAILPTHILFIPKSEDDVTRSVLEKLKREPVLTVGESDQFEKANGMINFSVEGDNVKFALNVSSAEAAHLKISSQLQKVARKVARF